ncbi:MAG: hypothetical protein A3B74_02645 [Candidatus Kerfeldbacteria bacterium RIFCSPHIGHO2_02_FULL_42_14]|uniref:DUF4383 domain-containing protein n=1 Tax=Candidatus Kerfeldbacteria bacterium RIFCSPHIGHO2_02_FULL_42_14 TaxID=1798540 RepID=A0A1G2AUJ0_9BACT|nr:MAG: hypothetical protein A3B74_02645 [Candidatus Kerfeldbacteria bacterium RIFCSPHIGHO2_02_FULL_42_14]OGY80439.1 MAG: hypothetical protein A3E60_05265 [Candidatus Kerfeldbacteria bacterium RIFCSPHIGHO2_12_FULL_42_13]OGY83869.1 MAG: hypothetical protein A3I91_04790 [Candidatus Kerfeldbacteria bacterium RIFCSPLOWO2_02_FULL_42_19]OGY86592.1 MAG: hypothetical protein A3G01_05040 [Candidatus Kerfeldbacteria bacterium RIFCSPLOWO2_12_FULL_43_9]
MNAKQFLLIGGIVLILVAILGFAGVIGPEAAQSIFKQSWFFDNAENWAHLVLGIVGVIGSFILPATLQKPIVLLLGIVGVVVGLYSLFGPVTEGNNLLGAQLQNPADTILHIVVGIWALWAAKRTQTASTVAQA